MSAAPRWRPNNWTLPLVHKTYLVVAATRRSFLDSYRPLTWCFRSQRSSRPVPVAPYTICEDAILSSCFMIHNEWLFSGCSASEFHTKCCICFSPTARTSGTYSYSSNDAFSLGYGQAACVYMPSVQRSPHRADTHECQASKRSFFRFDYLEVLILYESHFLCLGFAFGIIWGKVQLVLLLQCIPWYLSPRVCFLPRKMFQFSLYYINICVHSF